MARVSAVIYKQFRRSDGTYNVRIKVFHKNERRLMSGDSVELDHHIPAQADHPFRAKLTSAFRAKLTTPNT